MKQALKGLLSLSLLMSAGLQADSCNPCNNNNSCSTSTVCNTSSSCNSSCTTSCDFSDCNDSQNRCCDNDVYFGRTVFSYRPQGMNAARDLMGRSQRTHIFGREEFYAVFGLGLSYSQTFDRDSNCRRSLGTWFAPTCSNCITFGPDQNAATAAANPALLSAVGINDDLKTGVNVRGLDFGLSASHKSTICINPKIKNVVADLDFWFGLDEFVCGLWARVNVPLTWTKWQVCTSETTANAGGTNYGVNTVSCSTLPSTGVVSTNPAVVYSGATAQRDAWCGDQAFGQVPALKYGKLCSCKNDDFSVSGIRFDLGYDFWRSECGHIGAGVTVVAGVGTRSRAESLFRPSVGANHAWQFGGTVNGSYELWSNNEESSLTALVDATFVHVFRERQHRLFGLKENGPWSQYLLLNKFTKGTDGTFTLVGFERAANILAGEVKIKNDIMLDAALGVAYKNCNFTGTVGADVWFRSREKISDCCGFGIEENTYGVKGLTGCDTQTASLSTINTSLGVAALNVASTGTVPVNTTGLTLLPAGVPTNVNDGYTLAGTVYTPNTVTIKSTSVDTAPGLHPDALSGKVFGSLEYSWEDCDWEPFVLVGGEVEFGRGNTAVDQWEVTFKGGVAF